MARTRHTNLEDFEGAKGTAQPLSARRRIQFTHAVTQAATVRRPEDPKATAVRCIARVERGLCGDWIHVVFAADVIAWSCPGCAENGFVSGFAKGAYDLSPYRLAAGPARLWALDDESYRVLVLAAAPAPAMTAVLARATPRDGASDASDDGRRIDLDVPVAVDELDRIYRMVTELSDDPLHRPSPEVLERIGLSLAEVMDGPAI